VAYRAGLGRVPKRREAEIQSTVDVDDDTPLSEEDRDESSPKEDEIPMTPEETECAKARAVLNANIGACFVKLVSLISCIWGNFPEKSLVQDDHKQAVEACSQGTHWPSIDVH
jgi:hypothetical protein